MSERAKVYAFSWFNKWYAIRLFVLGVMWIGCLQCALIVKDIEPLKTFIPNEILGVATDASVAQVKKAYRKLSREKHPDKNPDNPEAVNEFIQITKAYTVSKFGITNLSLSYRSSPMKKPERTSLSMVIQMARGHSQWVLLYPISCRRKIIRYKYCLSSS